MKIAIFSIYNGMVERGVEVWVQELSRELTKLGYEIDVYMNGEKKSGDYKVISNRVKFDLDRGNDNGILKRFFFDYKSRIIGWWTFLNLRHYLKSDYDVAIPTNGGWQVALLRIVTWIKGDKMVVVGHSGPGWDERNNLWSFPDLFIAISGYAQKWAMRANPFVRSTVINNGINLMKFSSVGARVKLKLEKPVYLGVGVFSEGKRQELLIEAVSKLKKGSLILLGDGERKEYLEKLGKKKLGRGRFLIKKVKHRDMPKYYRGADVFSLPVWKHEAWGLVFLEAMACGLPVVTSNDEIRRKIVGKAGILVEVENAEEYAKALERAGNLKWDNKPRLQAEKFTWSKIAQKYDKVLSSLI